MTPELYVTRALPNPAGKDRRPPAGPTNEQLNGEWVEFANTAIRELSLKDVELHHTTFDRRCTETGRERVTSFTGVLGSRLAVRVHTGSGTGYWEGAVFHMFLGRGNFVWNNACSDRVELRLSDGRTIDWAAYAPNPLEGAVLTRVANTNRLA